MQRAFIIRPFDTKQDASGKKIDFERIDRELITPVLKTLKIEGGGTGQIVESGNIRADMFALILEADLVVCDITLHNANVFYELGIRHALRKKATVLIKGKPTSDGTPFDLSTDRYLAYDIDNPESARDALIATITATLKAERETDSPIFQMLPSLAEADPSSVKIVPLDFREEVRRAQAAGSKGWLRLLSEEVRRLRFQWEGLKLVGSAQWDLADYDGALDSWEAIRKIYPHDIAANLALANIYERQYRREKNPVLLERSEQAINRVLGNHSTDRKQRAEALALKGRNQKTRWRLGFRDMETVQACRKAALNRALIRSYQAYRDAFSEDLNHFYPGLNALQMGTILIALKEADEWYDAFESDREADRYREKLEKEVSSLRALIPMSVEAQLRRMDESNPERVWAKISNADMLFLINAKREGRVIGAYRDAIPIEKPFAWGAARGQLSLFASLGVQAELAHKVINELDGRFANRQAEDPAKPVHLVVFAGHRIDSPGRSKPRFPEAQANQAKVLIHETFQELIDGQHEVITLASAAPGADILAHDVCDELGLTHMVCLPMPANDFAAFAFEGLDGWRSRFLDLQRNHDVIVLSNQEGLPNWLHGSDIDPWERGNQWVMMMALTWGADLITLVSLWDGKRLGDAPGGTAQMVALAENAGNVHIKLIDSTQLLK